MQELKFNTLTEVTDSYDNHVIACIVSTTKKYAEEHGVHKAIVSLRGLYTIRVLWTSNRCTHQSVIPSTNCLRNAPIRQYEDIRYKSRQRLSSDGVEPGSNIIIFNAVGTTYVVIPHQYAWIHYRPVAYKMLPIYIGRSDKLDQFIADQIRRR